MSYKIELQDDYRLEFERQCKTENIDPERKIERLICKTVASRVLRMIDSIGGDNA